MDPSHEAFTQEWDFFIAHSNEDKDTARMLYTYIKATKFTAFLDQISIPKGSYWDESTLKAQNASLITIALISSNVQKAHYARDEIHTGIKLTRNNPEKHKIVPIYLDSLAESSDTVYGLRLIQGISLTSVGTLEKLAEILCDIATEFKLKKKP
jgi:TIR domain